MWPMNTGELPAADKEGVGHAGTALAQRCAPKHLGG
ncbi:MAG: hypothetical protein JWO57_1093 [Pseudonocardiales bacterium]|nr:hypothetical protein [Pseudonocardiales bacterium]